MRAARRRLGVDQRRMAERVGTSKSTLARWETGRSTPSLVELERVLAVAGLDLLVAPRVEGSAPRRLEPYLRLSLTQRLRVALGESVRLSVRPTTTAWSELVQLSRIGRVVLQPPLAHALWLPLGRVDDREVEVHTDGPLPALHALRATRVSSPAPLDLVRVILSTGRSVSVATPGVLAAFDARTTLLRQADALLHVTCAVDEAGRRRMPHRDPDEPAEDWRLLVTKSVDPRRIPAGGDSRAWRIAAAASLSQHLRDQ